MSSDHQLHPLEKNPHTGEPFLRLRNHPNIILTPPRWSDGPYISSILNDDKVHIWLNRQPYPCLPEHAQALLEKTIPRCNDILAELEEARNETDLKTVNGCPVQCLRELKADGTDIYIGDCTFKILPDGVFLETGKLDWDRKAKNEEQNNSRKAGDPEIVWSIADFLASSHHGQGIMTDAVRTVLHEWAIPRMNVHRVIVAALASNIGSRRVFEKNGFAMTGTYPFEVKRRTQNLCVMEWNSEWTS